MDKYSHYKVEDFLADDAFFTWVLSPDRVAEKYWQEVFLAYPNCKQEAEEARQILLSIKIKPGSEMPLVFKKKIIEEAFNGLDQEAEKVAITKKYKFSNWMVAASISLVFILGYYNYQKFFTQNLRIVNVAGALHTKKISNTSKIPLLIELPDFSTVVLHPQSYIIYNIDSFSTNREVFLLGKAFFDVTKKQGTPFVVNTSYLTTKVLGTSFTILASEVAQHKVTVNTGLVQVSRRKVTNHPSSRAYQRNNQAILVKPLQEVMVKENMLHVSEVADEVQSEEESEDYFNFQATPLWQVAEKLNVKYGIKVEITNKLLANRTITASLGSMSFHEKLHLICKAAEASYEIQDGIIFFNLIH